MQEAPRPTLRRLTRRVVLLGAGIWAQPAPALEAGASAPDFELPARDGPPRRLGDSRGRLVYLDFWASWCGPCKLSFPWMADLHERLGSRGLHVLAINVDARAADAQRFLAAQPKAPPVVFDAAGQTPKAFAVKAMPTSFLLDREGRVLWRHAGFSASDREPLEQRIVRALESPGGAR